MHFWNKIQSLNKLAKLKLYLEVFKRFASFAYLEVEVLHQGYAAYTYVFDSYKKQIQRSQSQYFLILISILQHCSST